MSKEKKLSKGEKALHWLHAWMRWYNVKFIPLLRLASSKKTKQTLREQKEAYQHLKSLIESSAQEPSEAEVEEFVEKWLFKIIEDFNHARKCEYRESRYECEKEWTQNNLNKMLKEYRKLLRRG